MTTQTYKIKAKVEGKRDIKGLQKALGNTQTKLMSMSKAATLAGVALAAIGTYKFIKGLVQVGKEVEGLQLRFKFLFGSAKEGARAFQTLTDFAATVPFSLQDIAMASGNLAIVSEDAEQLTLQWATRMGGVNHGPTIIHSVDDGGQPTVSIPASEQAIQGNREQDRNAQWNPEELRQQLDARNEEGNDA